MRSEAERVERKKKMEVRLGCSLDQPFWFLATDARVLESLEDRQGEPSYWPVATGVLSLHSWMSVGGFADLHEKVRLKTNLVGSGMGFKMVENGKCGGERAVTEEIHNS